MRLTPQQRIERASVSLMRDRDFMFLAGILVYGNTEVVSDPDITARTDGVNVLYGEQFIDKLTDPELMGLVLHEKLHCAFKHMSTWQHYYDENPLLANMACDFVINLIILDRSRIDRFVTLPAGGCIDEQYRGMDAGEVYRLLVQKYGDDAGAQAQLGMSGGFDDHDWSNAAGMSQEEIEELTRGVDQALRQGSILASKAGANVDRSITDMLEPKVDWRTALREFVSNSKPGDDYTTFRRIDRRFTSQGMTMPTPYSDHVHRVVLAVDTSGSIDNQTLAEFLAEAQGVCESVKPDMVDIMYWGDSVAAHEVYEGATIQTMRSSTKPRGGGGTAPSCVTQYMRDNNIRPDCIVVLSDGYVGDDWGGAWPAPTLWCLNSKHITAPVGVTVHI